MKGASVRTSNSDGMTERSFTMPRFRRFFHCAVCLDRARDGPEIPAGKHSTRNGTSGVRGHLRILRSDGTCPSICRFYCFYRRKTFGLSSFFHEKRKKSSFFLRQETVVNILPVLPIMFILILSKEWTAQHASCRHIQYCTILPKSQILNFEIWRFFLNFLKFLPKCTQMKRKNEF